MKCITAVAVLLISLVSLATEPNDRARAILKGMDCSITEMGKGISGIRSLSESVENDIGRLARMSSG